MPGFTTHYLFGLDTYHMLTPSPLKQMIRQNHAAFSLGLQGPDVFFYFLPSYTIRRHNIGSIAHIKDTNAFFSHLINSRELFQDPKQRQAAEAYTAGFIGHYILDTNCHPYIYWKTNFQKKSNRYYSEHMRLETEIDQLLLEYGRQCRPSAFRQDATIRLNKLQMDTICTILHHVYQKCYPELGVLPITMRAAIRSIQIGTRFVHDPSGKKKKIISNLEKRLFGFPLLSTLIPSDNEVLHEDPLNLKHRQWKNPWDTTLVSKASFLDLMEQAQEQYTHIMAKLFPYRETQNALLDTLGNLSYHSGLDAGIPS